MHLHMKQSIPPPRNLQQDVLLGWTQPGEASVGPSQSASSAVISPASGHSSDFPSDSLEHSSTSLKERDYIGLAEVSSAPPCNELDRNFELNLSETDLRLGLGLSTDAPTDSIIERKDRVVDGVLHIRNDTKLLPSSSRQSLPPKTLVDSMASTHANIYQSSVQLAMSKNGGKRLYAETMVDAYRDRRPIINANSAAGMLNSIEPRSSMNPMSSLMQPQDPEAKPFVQGMCRGAPHVIPWQSQNDSGSSYYRPTCSPSSQPFSIAMKGNGDNEVLSKPNLDLKYCNDLMNLHAVGSQGEAHDEAPPAKGQVVGWPPVRSYRRSTLAARPKPVVEESDSQSAIYVKVNMDGIPIGRKVDLSIYKSYDGLLSALEDMFRNLNGGYGAQFLKGSEFVLTYEDKEGDWMLVGDVPWSMFINTVRRLRITSGPDMAGCGSRISTCHT